MPSPALAARHPLGLGDPDTIDLVISEAVPSK